MSTSGDSVGKASSRGSGASRVLRATQPAGAQAQSRTNRADLELDQPLQHLEQPLEPLENLFVQPSPVRRGNSYWPADMKQVKRSYRCNLVLGFILIVVMVGGAIFGVIFSLVETHGDFAAANSYIANPNYTDTTTASPAVSTNFIPSLYSILVPSRFSTLVPSEITILVKSEDTTSVFSEATTLIPSDITLTQRSVASPSLEITNADPTNLVRKIGSVNSTTGVILSVTTTVTVKVYRTTFGLHDLQSDLSVDSESQPACVNGAQDGHCTQDSFTSSASLTSLLDMTSSGSTMLDVDDSSRHTATLTLTTVATVAIIPTITDIDKSTVTLTDMCAAAGISSILPCDQLPTGWYISPAAPRATSFLQSLFRLLSTCLHHFKDSGGVLYPFLYHGVVTAWTSGRNLLAYIGSDGGSGGIDVGIGKVLNALLGFLPRYQ